MTQQFYSCIAVDERNFSTHEQIASAVEAMIRAVGRGGDRSDYDLDWSKAEVRSDYYIGDEHIGPHDRLTLIVHDKVGA